MATLVPGASSALAALPPAAEYAEARRVFIPEGYLWLPDAITWLAGLGEQGKLPRRLGFVHPGDDVRPEELSAEENARRVVGEKLAAGAITAEAILDQSGEHVPIRLHYWSSSSAHATMKEGWVNLDVIGRDSARDIALAIIKIDAVAAALGFRLVPSDAPEDPGAPKAPEARPNRPPSRRGRSYRAADEPLIAEMHERIVAGLDKTAKNAARFVAHKAVGDSTDESKVERLAAGYLRVHGQPE